MIIMGKINLDGGGIAVTLNEKSGISPLKGDGESLEEKLNFFRVIFSPSSRTLTRHVLQKLNRSRVPSAKSLDNEGLKDNPLRPARDNCQNEGDFLLPSASRWRRRQSRRRGLGLRLAWVRRR